MGSKSILFALFFCLIITPTLLAQTKTIDSLKRVISKMPDDSNKVLTYRQLFIETVDKQNADAGIPVASAQLKLAEKIYYDRGRALAYKLLSVAYENTGDMDKAIANSLNSLKIYEKLKDKSGIGSSYSNIGLVYFDEKETADALSYFEKSLAIFSKIKGKQENVFRCLLNIGRTYEQEHQDSLALKCYIQSLPVGQTLISFRNIYLAEPLYHIGNLYFNGKQYQASQIYLTRSLDSLKGAQEAYPASEIYILLSKIYIVQKQYDKALQSAQKGLMLVKKEDYKMQLAENYLQMANVYAALKNYGQAYTYEALYTKLKDSLVNTENVKAIAKYQYNYNLEKKENINRELLKDKKLNDAEILLQKITIQRQYAIGAFIGVGLLSFLVLSVFYYRGLQDKKKDNELLQLQQQEILEQNQEIIAQNEEISNQKDHLTQLNNTKNKLFSIISHDLRSPVLTLQDALSMFNDDLLTQDEIGPMSGELLKEVKSTSSMLDNVLFWAKNQMEGIYLKKEIFSIRDVIAANLNNFKKQAADKKITLTGDTNTGVKVIADISTIDIVVRNLVSNAIKFCSENDSISISTTIIDRFLFFSVADTGRGMSRETQTKIFDANDFYTTRGTANETGTGLGLGLCIEFVTLNGGSIWVESELGKGSTFTFTIPMA